MNQSRTHERATAKPSRSLLVALMVALVSLFAVGCGSSSDDFVFTGNNNPTPTTGSVTFQLAQANAQAVVPAATASLVFEFFDAQNTRVFGPVTRDFANSITIDGVPTSATNARITALDANGNPIATYTATFTVIAGGNVSATISAATPVTFSLNVTPDPAAVLIGGTQQLTPVVTFSDGSTASVTETGGAIAYTSAAPGTATVTSAGGLVTGVAVGNTQVVATFGLNGVSVSDGVVVTVTAPANQLVANPSAVNLTNTTTSQVVTTSFNGDTVAATGTLGDFTGDANESNLTFSSGTVSSSANVNGGATLTYTYTPEGGTAVTTTVPVTVNRGTGTPPGVGRLVLDQESLLVSPTPLNVTTRVSLLMAAAPTGRTASLSGTYYAPGSDVGIPLDGAVDNIFSATIASTVPAGTEGNWSFDSTNGSIRAQGPSGVPAIGNSVTYEIFFTAPGQEPVSDTVTVTTTSDPLLPYRMQSAEVYDYPGTLRLPVGAQFPVFIKTLRNDGFFDYVQPKRFIGADGIAVGDADGPGVVTLTSDSVAVGYSFAGGQSVMVFDSEGSAKITITRNTTGGEGGPSDLGGDTVESVPTSLLTTTPSGQPNVKLTIPVASTTVIGVLPYSVTLLFNDGTSTDLTPVATIGSTAPARVFQLLDADSAPTGFLTGLAAGGANVSLSTLQTFGGNLDSQLSLDGGSIAIITTNP